MEGGRSQFSREGHGPRKIGDLIAMGKMAIHVPLIFVCLLGVDFCQSSQAQQPDSTTHLRQDISNLQRDVKTLIGEQQQILDQLNELKRLYPASPAARPAPSLPSTVDVRREAFRGDSGATLAVIEYSDFECPYCGKYERETSAQIFDKYIKTGMVKLFYRDLPLPMHPHAMSAARAAHCAGEQGKYWEMHDSLFARQNALSDPALLDRAKTLGLDADKFNECFSSQKYADDIQKSLADAQKMGVDGTPTFFIGAIDPNGDVITVRKRIVGAHPYETFQSALDELLAAKSEQTVSSH
jgi:protein-disulfide isomerase